MSWLNMEIELVRPEIIVCLGAAAGQALRLAGDVERNPSP
jgi:uracil-DNA glycosylase